MVALGRLPDPPDDRDHPLALHVPNLAAIVATLPAYDGVDVNQTMIADGYAVSYLP